MKIGRMRLSIVNNLKLRDLTPTNHLCLTNENDDSYPFSFSQIIQSHSTQAKIKKKVGSYSLSKKDNTNLRQEIDKIINKNKSLPKKTLSLNHRSIGSIRKLIVSTSRNKAKKKPIKKKIPIKHINPLNDYLITSYHPILQTFQSNDTLLTNHSNHNHFSSKAIYTNASLNLNETQKDRLNEIKQSINSLLGMTENKGGVINELEMFLQSCHNDLSNTAASTNKTGQNSPLMTQSGNEKKLRAKSQQSQTQSSNDTLFIKIQDIDKKFEQIIEENTKLKSMLTEKTGSFEDVKKSLQTFKEEISKMQKSNNDKNNQSQTQLHKNAQGKLTNKIKFPMKNGTLNLQLIQKVNSNDVFKKDRELTAGNCISIAGEGKKVQALNLENLSKDINDFQEEFMENYKDFSPSWRKEVDRMNQRQPKCKLNGNN